MRTNRVKAMLANGENVLGTFVRTTHPPSSRSWAWSALTL